MDYRPLEETILTILQTFPYYGMLIADMDKKLVIDEKIPLAGVKVTDRIELFINPTAFNPLPLPIRCGIVLHECFHVIHRHMARAGGKFTKNHNIAADRAINEMLRVISNGKKVVATIPDVISVNGKDMKPVTAKNFQDQFKDKVVLDGQDMEYYYRFIQENAEESEGDGGDGFGDMETLDNHDLWEEGYTQKEVLDQVVKKALEKAGQRAGNTPGEIQEVLNELNRSSVPWNQVLQNFVAQLTQIKLESSRKRRNRRYGVVHPGTIKRPQLRLGVAIDTSGSVADWCLTQFFAELDKIHSLGIEIKLVLADCDVRSVQEYEPKIRPVIEGRGGTAFQPAINLLEKSDVDAILYCTDGESYEDLSVKKPILWCLCPSYTLPKGFSEKSTVKITEKKND